MNKILILLAFTLLTGCVTPPHKPVAMEANYFQNKTKKVGVILTQMPKPDLFTPGASCLLCIAAAEIANSSLNTHAESLIPDDFKLVETELVKQLKSKGVRIFAIDEKLDLEKLPSFSSSTEGAPEYDYRAFSAKYDITDLLVININSIGFNRNYSSYIPVDDPKAIIRGVSYLVDLSDNSFKWYKHISVDKSASGNWDEAPTFPALTNAYYQAIETGREMILKEF